MAGTQAGIITRVLLLSVGIPYPSVNISTGAVTRWSRHRSEVSVSEVIASYQLTLVMLWVRSYKTNEATNPLPYGRVCIFIDFTIHP